MSDSLRTRRILLVEDEVIIALAIEDMLTRIGCEVVGPAFSLAAGQALAASEPLDAAVLDLNLAGESSDQVAKTLQNRGIPFCFSTGYGSSAVPRAFQDRPVLQKPYTLQSLARVLDDLKC